MNTGSVSTLAGSSSGFQHGVGTNAQFDAPHGVSLTPDGRTAVIGDYYNDVIRLVTIATGAVTTLAGSAGSSGTQDGVGTDARFDGTSAFSQSLLRSFSLAVADLLSHALALSHRCH